MKQRIKELAEQAGFPEWSQKTIGFELEKFAELIVKECFQVVDDFGVEQSGETETQAGLSLLIGMKITEAAWKIKEHFGVKE